MLNGWIACDKPSGISCVKISRIVKHITGQKRIGHVGTLDPLATGIVTLALGEATKLIPHLQHPLKTYEFAVHWGEERDTDDTEGRITQTSSVIPSHNDIRNALPHFLGAQIQIPPLYSAVHIQGIRAYKLARRGETFDVPSREIYIEKLEWVGDNHFRVTCQAGTYVRALARDLAKFLGTVGHVAWLRRTCDGLFSTNNTNLWSCSRDDIPYVHQPDTLMLSYAAITLDDDQMQFFQRGMPVGGLDEQNGWARIYHNSTLRGIGKWDEGLLKPHRLLHIE